MHMCPARVSRVNEQWSCCAEAARQREAGHDAAQDPYFMHQHVRNACGTIGALHAIGNLPGHPPMSAQAYFCETGTSSSWISHAVTG